MRNINFINKMFPVNKLNFNSTLRSEWIKRTLQIIPAGKRILDAGAGQLANKEYCNHLEYVSQDFGEYDGIGDQKGLQTGTWDSSKVDIISDITAIPEPNSSFDVILCSEVFEHLPNPLTALDELVRLLKPGGYLILTAPFCSFTHFAPFYYNTGFSTYWYKIHLETRHLKILEIFTLGNYFSLLDQEIFRLPEMIKKYGNTSSLSFLERFSLRIVRYILNNVITTGDASKEFACFGHCLLAKKQ